MTEFQFVGLLLWGFAALCLLKFVPRKRKRFVPFSAVTQHDDQLTAVSASAIHFKTKPILWPREYRAFKAAQKVLVKYERTDCRLWAQVCLGELFSVESPNPLQAREAHSSINSKRSDIVLTDSKGYALALIEYQGEKHYQNTAYKRDAIKRIVAQQAGVRFIEIMAAWTDQQVEDALDAALQDLLKR